MIILTINTGSTSVKLALCEIGGDSVPVTLHAAAYASGVAAVLLRQFLDDCGEAVEAIAHRVVHGGEHLVQSTLIDGRVEQEIRRLAELAPLHNPVALRWIQASRQVLPRLPQVAVFDTAFFADLPAPAASYALPRELSQRLHIRRYGFHGLAHRAMWKHWQAQEPRRGGKGRLITLHLGGGASITAILDGRPLDTSMGFSPLEGLVMATRAGDLDPSIGSYLIRREGWSSEQLDQWLNHDCGLKGLSGGEADMRELLPRQDAAAQLAVEIYCYRAVKYLGAYISVLQGVDAIAFGGGVGEHLPEVRRRIIEGLGWYGVHLDEASNAATTASEGRISTPDSSASVWVLTVNEARVLAREAAAVLASG